MKDYWKENSPVIIFSIILLIAILWVAAITPTSQNIGSPQYCDTEGC